MNGMSLWKTIMESPNPQAVFNAYMRWFEIDGVCEEFLNRVVSALELYEEATSQTVLAEIGQSAVERLYFSDNRVFTVPFIRHYIGAAKLLASQLLVLQPGRDRLQLRGLEATETLQPGWVNKEAIATIRARVQAHDAKTK